MAGHSGPGADGRAASLIAQRGDLFVYGTLQFPDVLRVLLGRIPDSSAAALAGWRAAALARRTYPGLVPAAATVHGTLLSGLTADEVDLSRTRTAAQQDAWAYVWTDASTVQAPDWSAAAFAAEYLPGFVVQCRDWLLSRAAASTGGRPATRAHDPEVACSPPTLPADIHVA